MSDKQRHRREVVMLTIIANTMSIPMPPSDNPHDSQTDVDAANNPEGADMGGRAPEATGDIQTQPRRPAGTEGTNTEPEDTSCGCCVI